MVAPEPISFDPNVQILDGSKCETPGQIYSLASSTPGLSMLAFTSVGAESTKASQFGGRERTVNEDCAYFLLTEGGIVSFGVFDGNGGYFAAQAAVKVFSESGISTTKKEPLKVLRKIRTGSKGHNKVANIENASLVPINVQTTALVAQVEGNTLKVLSFGDSIGLLIKKNGLIAQELNAPDNIWLGANAKNEDLENGIQLNTFEIEEEDIVLLMTDGFLKNRYPELEDYKKFMETIKFIVSNMRGTDKSIRDIGHYIMDFALNTPGDDDNISLIIYQHMPQGK